MTRTPPATIRVVAGLSGLALGGLWWLTDPSFDPAVGPVEVALFALAAAVMELLPMRQPGGRAVPASLAVIGAAAILGMPPPVVALVAACGWLAARLVDRGGVSPTGLVTQVVGGWTFSGIAAAGVLLWSARFEGIAPAGSEAAHLHLGAAFAVAFAVVVGRPVIEELLRTHVPLRFMLRRLPEAIVASWLVGLALSSTSILGALVHPVLGLWTLPTMLIPLFAARIGLDRFAVAARAYDQTIRAMSRLPEQLGTVTEGHGVRVATLARQVGLELGLDVGTLTDLERASHLHELGRIQVERDAPATRRELSIAGASVIRETASLDRVARIVEAHGDPASAGPFGSEVSVPARIVAACCDIDRSAPGAGDQADRSAALLRLVRDVGDLEVVAALGRVLDRRTP